MTVTINNTETTKPLVYKDIDWTYTEGSYYVMLRIKNGNIEKISFTDHQIIDIQETQSKTNRS